MPQIEVLNDAGYPLDVARLEEAAAQVLAQHPGHDTDSLTVVITDNDSVADLNRQYRDVDAPTDVLSFPADMPALDGEPLYLGDLIIAFPYAQAQAERTGHDLMQSLSLLVVHGTLHLLGYDHDNDEHLAAMWAAQDAALEALDLPLNLVPSYEHD